MAITNHCVNPSAETAATGYTRTYVRAGLTGSAAYRSTNNPKIGSYCIAVDITGNGTTNVNSDFDIALPRHDTVAAGTTYVFSAHINHDGASCTYQWYLRWENAAGTNLGTFVSALTPALQGEYGRTYVSRTAVTGATRCVVQLWVFGCTEAVLRTFRIDNVQYEEGSFPRPYFDGDMPFGSWNGTAHASTSQIPDLAVPGPAVPTFGTDISYYRVNMNLTQARSEGIRFAFFKVGQGASSTGAGQTTDAQWANYVTKAKAAGLYYAGYWYIGDTESAASQASRCKAYMGDTTIPLAMDWEEGGGNWANVKAVIAAFRATGLTVRWLYCRASWWLQYGGPQLSQLNVYLWNARYGSNNPGTPQDLYTAAITPDPSFGWQNYGELSTQIYQYSDDSTIGGETPADADVFDGTPAQLKSLFAYYSPKRGALLSFI